MLKSKKTEKNTFALIIKQETLGFLFFQETLGLFNLPMYSSNILLLSYC